MEYRLDEHTGNLYTWDQFEAEWFGYDRDISRIIWNTMNIIEIPEGKLDELQEKMRFIYYKDYSLPFMDFDKCAYVKDPTKTLKIVPKQHP